MPELCAFQLAPPLLVARMVPSVPTAQPWLALAKATPKRITFVPELCAFQVAPPLLVARMVPSVPTAQPSLALAKATPVRASLVPELCQLQPVAAKAPAGSAKARPSRISVKPRSFWVRRRAADRSVGSCFIWSPPLCRRRAAQRPLLPTTWPQVTLQHTEPSQVNVLEKPLPRLTSLSSDGNRPATPVRSDGPVGLVKIPRRQGFSGHAGRLSNSTSYRGSGSLSASDARTAIGRCRGTPLEPSGTRRIRRIRIVRIKVSKRRFVRLSTTWESREVLELVSQ